MKNTRDLFKRSQAAEVAKLARAIATQSINSSVIPGPPDPTAGYGSSNPRTPKNKVQAGDRMTAWTLTGRLARVHSLAT